MTHYVNIKYIYSLKSHFRDNYFTFLSSNVRKETPQFKVRFGLKHIFIRKYFPCKKGDRLESAKLGHHVIVLRYQ
jgi:hypothetical protein